MNWHFPSPALLRQQFCLTIHLQGMMEIVKHLSKQCREEEKNRKKARSKLLNSQRQRIIFLYIGFLFQKCCKTTTCCSHM